mgnify:CR=1 FL=1
MKIVFAASEAAPFLKTGGLGDVAEALPRALSDLAGNEVALFLPYYKKIKYNPEIKADFIKSFSVDLSWRRQHVGVFRLHSRRRKLQVYFLDNDYYFGGRDSIYGDADDGERFAYFSKAVLQTLCELNMQPDILHCNDWQTALIPVLLRAFYQQPLGQAKTVFTIHNIEYQGKADPYFLGDMLALPPSYRNTMMYDDCVNFMKGAILMTDALTTVSRSYAQEIRYPYYAHGLAPVIEEHAFKLSGVVNGINTTSNDPNTDPALWANYDVLTAREGKSQNKAALQQWLGLPVRQDAAMIGMVSRLVTHKGMDLVCEALEELSHWQVQVVLLGTGDAVYEQRLRSCAERHPDKIALRLCFDSALASRIYAASDLYLMPSKSEPCGLSQLIAMRYGAIPVVHKTGGLADTVLPFNPETQQGTGFDFQQYHVGDMLDALRRALSLYGGDPPAFGRLIQNAMKRDSSWRVPAGEYNQLYCALTGRGE